MSVESRKNQYGVVFGHWQIGELLGSGSNGKSAVFRLRHTASPEIESALKVVCLIEEKGRLCELSDERRQEYELAREQSSRDAEREVLLMDALRGNTNIVDYMDHGFVDWEDENGFGRDNHNGGHALVETGDGKLGWVRMDRLSETNDFTY